MKRVALLLLVAATILRQVQTATPSERQSGYFSNDHLGLDISTSVRQSRPSDRKSGRDALHGLAWTRNCRTTPVNAPNHLHSLVGILLPFGSQGVYAGRYLFDKQSAAVQGQYACQESWQIVPNNNPDRIYLMQCAYRRAIGAEDPYGAMVLDNYYNLKFHLGSKKVTELFPPRIKPSPDEDKKKGDGGDALATLGNPKISQGKDKNQKEDKKGDSGGTQVLPLKIPYHQFVKSGWFCVGKKHDVPKKCVRYVGHHCDTYVWVTGNNLDDLTKFTLAILDIATPFTIDPSTGDAVRASNPYGLLPVPPPASIR